MSKKPRLKKERHAGIAKPQHATIPVTHYALKGETKTLCGLDATGIMYFDFDTTPSMCHVCKATAQELPQRLPSPFTLQAVAARPASPAPTTSPKL